MASDYAEGKAKFKIGEAFFRVESRMSRDLGILAAKVYRQNSPKLRLLDAMAGCGVRSLRYLLESKADWVWVNEGNPNLIPLLQDNLKSFLLTQQVQLSCENAKHLLSYCFGTQDYYDFIDLDGFGSGAEFILPLLQAVKLEGLIYLTSTDGRSLTGHLPEHSLSEYGVYARSHPAAQEQGLRILLGSLQQGAASQGRGIEPIFAFFTGETYRVMVRLVEKPQLTPENYGFLGYCHNCGDYQSISWRKLGQTLCPNDHLPLTLTGALWLGKLHDRNFLVQMQQTARQWGWEDCVKLLDLMEGEADLPPYFYTLGEIGKRGKLDIPARSQLIQTLQDQGYQAAATHINPEAIKTNASLKTCIAIAQGTINN